MCLLLVISMAPAFSLDTSTTTDPGDGASFNRLRQFMLRQPSAGVPNEAGSTELTPERQQERLEWIQAGEAALARRNWVAALASFENATYIRHGIDTDASLARAYLQGGQYQRALALGSHMAGVHAYAENAAVLYVWLLHLGGQPAVAKRVLQAAQERWPRHGLLDQVGQQLSQTDPQALGPLLAPPMRLAPYGDSEGLAPNARVVGSATLLHDGRHALVPVALLSGAGRVWLRNGLGQLTPVAPPWRALTPDLALVTLTNALPVADDPGVAPDDPLPGRRAYTVEYVPAPHADPAWPVLRVGSWGEAFAGTGGGPVWDATGRLIGVALSRGEAGSPGWLGMSGLYSALSSPKLAPQSEAFGTVTGTDPRGGDAIPRIYERGLKTSLQVIATPSPAHAQQVAPIASSRPPPPQTPDTPSQTPTTAPPSTAGARTRVR